MKKKILIAVAVFFTSLILWYSAAAFAQWDLNPGKWSEPARALVGSIGFFMSFVSAVFYIGNSDFFND